MFFCRAVLESIERLNLRPEVLHLNDWQTGLIPALYQTEYRQRPDYPAMATLLPSPPALPVAERAADEVLCLPMFAELEPAEAEMAAAAVAAFFEA